MALTSTAQTSAKPAASVHKKETGDSNQPTIYTVPSGRYFEGYIYTSNAQGGTFKINNVEVNYTINQASTNGRPHLFVLVEGDTVQVNANGSYYTYIHGAEYDI